MRHWKRTYELIFCPPPPRAAVSCRPILSLFSSSSDRWCWSQVCRDGFDGHNFNYTRSANYLIFYKSLIFVLVIMQLRVKAMYGKIMSRLITIFWILETLAVLALGIASLAAIDGKTDVRFLSELKAALSLTFANFASDPIHARRNSNVQSDVFTSFCIFILGAHNCLWDIPFLAGAPNGISQFPGNRKLAGDFTDSYHSAWQFHIFCDVCVPFLVQSQYSHWLSRVAHLHPIY